MLDLVEAFAPVLFLLMDFIEAAAHLFPLLGEFQELLPNSFLFPDKPGCGFLSYPLAFAHGLAADLQGVQFLGELAQVGVELAESVFHSSGGFLLSTECCAEFFGALFDLLELVPMVLCSLLAFLQLFTEAVPVASQEEAFGMPPLHIPLLPLPGLLCLLTERGSLLPKFCQQGFNPFEVVPDTFQLTLRFTPAQFILAYSCCFFQEAAPLFRAPIEELLDHPQLDHRVAVRSKAGIQEELLDVSQPAWCSIEPVLALPVAVHAACHNHVRELYRQHPRGVLHRQRHFRHPRGLECPAPIEDELFERLAAQHRQALLSEHPPKSVHNVALAASVRSDNRRQPFGEDQDRPLCKGFEPEQFQPGDEHRRCPN